MGRQLKLLFIEDRLDDAELMTLALNRGGLDFAWERVETAEQLGAALASGGWDAVVSDYTLPGFDIESALGQVRESDPDLPFVVVSGTVRDDMAVEIMRAGANDYVLKHNLVRLAPALDREVREARNRRARRASERAAAHLAAVVESSGDAIFSETVDGIVTSWNPAAGWLFGWTAEEAIGQHMSFIVPPGKAEEFAKVMERVRRGESIERFETVWLNRDGTGRDAAITISPICDRDGGLVGISKIARDIGERKRAQEMLRDKEAKLEEALRLARLGYWNRDLATGKLDGSDELYGMFGVSPETFGRTYESFLATIHPDDRQVVSKRIAEAVDVAGSFDHTYRIIVRGNTRVIHEVGHTLALGDGAPYRVAGTAQDVTERTQSIIALCESEQRFRTLVAATSAIVWTTPASGEFEAEQPGWSAFTGQTFDQLRGWGWLNAVHPDDRENTALVWTAAYIGKSLYQVEHRLRQAEGEYRHMSVRAVPILAPDGSLREWVGVHTDVTDRILAEEALRLRDRAIGAASQGILITAATHPNNPIVYVSPGFEKLTGYESNEVLGHNCRFLQGKDTDPEAVAQLRAAVQVGEPCKVEILNYRKDGVPYWGEVSISPIRDAAGRLTHFVGVHADVTTRRALEEQLRHSQKMEAVGQLAGGVAHDFNNLLTIINGYSDLLLQNLPPGDSSRELLVEIHKAGERSAGLTRQLLAFSRKQVLAPQVLDLNAVVIDAEKMLRRIIGEDIRLATALGTELGAVRADPGQLEQVLLNLAVNARDAMPIGGRLAIETGNFDLDEEFVRAHPGARTGPHVLMAVSDTGCGMTPEVRARVFEPYFTTKGPGKGTGLGLATVFGVVQQSDGTVDVVSEIGVGTTFMIYLPRVEKAVDTSGSRQDHGATPRGTETILLVEDEDGVRALTRYVLAGCGYTMLEAVDGEEAVRVAEGHGGPIHILVTDVVMPGVGGQVVAEQVTTAHPEARVLFVSGYTDDSVVRHGILSERVNFLQKPFSPVALAHKVREVLDASPKNI